MPSGASSGSSPVAARVPLEPRVWIRHASSPGARSSRPCVSSSTTGRGEGLACAMDEAGGGAGLAGVRCSLPSHPCGSRTKDRDPHRSQRSRRLLLLYSHAAFATRSCWGRGTGEVRDGKERTKRREFDRCVCALGTLRGPWRRVVICGGLLLSLVALSCASSDDVSGGPWSCVGTSGDSGAPICVCCQTAVLDTHR